MLIVKIFLMMACGGGWYAQAVVFEAFFGEVGALVDVASVDYEVAAHCACDDFP